jgi:hypothetical protein
MATLIVRASLLYWGLAFAAGWLLGPIREFSVVPRFGQTAGVLLEAPLMLLVIFAATGWTIRWLPVPRSAAPWIGLGGLGLLIVAEIAGLRWARGPSVANYIETLTPVSAAGSLLMFGLFAAMPALVAQGRQ